MNERIRELAKNAGFSPFDSQSELVEKFAELILADCIKVVDETPLGYGDYRDQILESMRNSCVDSIKYHFGVE